MLCWAEESMDIRFICVWHTCSDCPLRYHCCSLFNPRTSWGKLPKYFKDPRIPKYMKRRFIIPNELVAEYIKVLGNEE